MEELSLIKSTYFCLHPNFLIKKMLNKHWINPFSDEFLSQYPFYWINLHIWSNLHNLSARLSIFYRWNPRIGKMYQFVHGRVVRFYRLEISFQFLNNIINQSRRCFTRDSLIDIYFLGISAIKTGKKWSFQTSLLKKQSIHSHFLHPLDHIISIIKLNIRHKNFRTIAQHLVPMLSS